MTRSDHKWKPPEVNQLKINVGASVMAGQSYFAIGLVIRNHQGKYIAGKVIRFAGAVSVLETELIGIWEAFLWSQGISGDSISVESDFLLSVNAINQGHDNVL